MKYTICVLTFTLFGVLESSVYSQAVYERSNSYKSLRLTYKDLSDLLLSTQEFLTDLSTDSTNVHTDQLSIKDMSEEIEISGKYQLDAFTKAPNKGIYVSYEFSATKHPIRRVKITLSDYRREVVASGSSLTQVQALSAMVHELLKPKETIMGAVFRKGESFLIAIYITLTGVFLFMMLMNRKDKILRYIQMALILLFPIYIGCLFFVPWEEWFPGTAIYMDSANFLERNASLFSFLSFLIGIPGLLAFIFWIVNRKKGDN